MITKSSCSVEDRNAAQLGLFEFAMWMLAKIVVLLAVHITDLVNDRTYLVDKSTTSVQLYLPVNVCICCVTHSLLETDNL